MTTPIIIPPISPPEMPVIELKLTAGLEDDALPVVEGAGAVPKAAQSGAVRLSNIIEQVGSM